MIPLSKPFIGDNEKQAILEVLDSGMLAQGPRVASLEQKFAEVCGINAAVATSSGTTALHLALLAHDIGPGDEVITTPFTFFASVSSILHCGARPVFVDIEEDTYNINPDLIEEAITPRTRAILPVHLFGYPCDMAMIMTIAQRYNLVVIEDACQAIGAEFQGQRVGSFGVGCFSLYATKNIMAGEGGIITTRDEQIAQRCRLLRNHGMQRPYLHEMIGYNFRLSDLHAALGLAQIARLDELTAKRQQNAAFLSAGITSAITPGVRPGYRHVWHQYTIRLPGGRRDVAAQQLNTAGVGTGIFYPIPASHQQPLLKMGYGNLSFPVAEKMAQEVLSLPVHPLLSQQDLEKIVTEVNRLKSIP
jgi:dTDP-4-amino-4,6-dideoxygalactose transaminase